MKGDSPSRGVALIKPNPQRSVIGLHAESLGAQEVHARDFAKHVTSQAENAPLTGKCFGWSVLREHGNEIKFQYFWIWLIDFLF